MKPLIINGTEDTLEVVLNKEDGLISFRGKSYPEDIESFFVPVVDWIEEYISDPVERTTVMFRLEYFNTSTSRKLLEILLDLEKINEQGRDIRVEWYYNAEDDDIFSAGRKFSVLSKLPFEIHSF